MAVTFYSAMLFIAVAVGDQAGIKSVSDKQCADTGSHQEKTVLMQKTMSKQLTVDADAAVTEASIFDEEVVVGSEEVFADIQNNASVNMNASVKRWDFNYGAPNFPMDWSLDIRPLKLALDGAFEKPQSWGTLSKQKNWAMKQIMKMSNTICKEWEKPADAVPYQAYDEMIDQLAKMTGKTSDDIHNELHESMKSGGMGYGYSYGLVETNASLEKQNDQSFGNQSQVGMTMMAASTKMRRTRATGDYTDEEIELMKQLLKEDPTWFLPTATMGDHPWSPSAGPKPKVNCGKHYNLPHLPVECVWPVYFGSEDSAYTYCTSSDAVCAEKMVEIALSWATVASSMVPYANAVSKAAKGAKASLKAGTKFSKVVKEFAEEVGGQFFQVMKKTAKDNLKDYIKDKLKTAFKDAANFAATGWSSQHKDAIMEEIIEGGVDMMTWYAAEQAQNGGSMHPETVVKEIIETLEPTGIMSAISSMDADYFCSDLALDDMPTDGLEVALDEFVCDETVEVDEGCKAGFNKAEHCYKGASYQGCQTKTISGRTCQKWTAQSPHQHTRTYDNEDFAWAGLGDHNYCRNPDKEPTIWCYTTDPAQRFELCNPLPQMPSKYWLGCYKDDAQRDLEDGPKAYGYTVATCDLACGAFKYFALQHNGQCFCGNEAGHATQYTKRPDSECGQPCKGETAAVDQKFCGGAWRNAVYLVQPKCWVWKDGSKAWVHESASDESGCVAKKGKSGYRNDGVSWIRQKPSDRPWSVVAEEQAAYWRRQAEELKRRQEEQQRRYRNYLWSLYRWTR